MDNINPYIQIFNIVIKERHLSVKELSILTGLSPSTVYGMVNRNTVPRVETMLRICNALNIRLSEYLLLVEQIMDCIDNKS